MLTCTAARRFLYAFADGELAVKENCDVLDHLKMCPDCARVVADQQALRASLGRVTESVAAPPGFANAVLDSLDPPAASRPARRWVRIFVPIAAAAASIAFVSFSIWHAFASRAPEPVPAVGTRQIASSDAAASRVVQVHEYCCNLHDQHQDVALPQGLAGLSPAMAAHFNNIITVLAPDFSTSGFQFESANYCGFKPRNRGAHLIYVAHAEDRDPKRLSFFSIPRWSYLDRCPAHKGLEDHDFRKFTVPEERSSYAVVAWHDNQTTYICCGEMSVPEMISMVEPVRVVLKERGERIALALGSINALFH